MNLITGLLNKFGLIQKSKARLIMPSRRNWQAASIDRLTKAWSTQTLSSDSELRRELPPLRARSRKMRDDNTWGKSFINLIKNGVVGDYGVTLKNKAKDPSGDLDVRANELIEEAWWDWSQFGNCTVDRQLSFCNVQNIETEGTCVDGEGLIRIIRGFNNKHSFALQLMEPDVLDTEKNESFSDGREIRMGVEYNTWREPVAYHLRTYNPNDTSYGASRLEGDRYERIPARDIIHLFLPYRVNQTRGVPWMATALYPMNMVGKYEEAEVTAARAAACKMGIIIKDESTSGYQGPNDGMGNKLMDAEPGAFEELPFGTDLKVLDWNHPNSSYQAFMKTCLRGMAAGLGVSYISLGNDMEAVNFASGRLGIEAERELFKALQCWLIERFINRIYAEWLTVQLLTQNIPLPMAKFDKFNSPDWRPRRWNYIQPQDEIDADIRAINAGLTSRQRVLAKRGLERSDIDQEQAEDKESAEALGLEFPELEAKTEPQTDPETPVDEAH